MPKISELIAISSVDPSDIAVVIDVTDQTTKRATIAQIRGAAGGAAGTVTPEQYLAVGNGIADDTACLQAALDALHTAGGGCLVLGGNKNYLVSSLVGYANTRITGQGNSSVISSVSNAAILSVSGDNITCDNFMLSGGWGYGTGQKGIVVGSGVNFLAHNVNTYALGGHSFHVTASAANFQGHKFSDCNARLNLFATAFYISGQYVDVVNCSSYGCAKGIVIDAGNVKAIGCSFNASNVRNLEITNAANDAHGVISGCNLNHADPGKEAVYVGAIVNGSVFRGCNIFYGDIRLVSSNGVRFVGCQIDVDHIYFDGSQGTWFNGNTWNRANTNTLHASYNGHASTEWFDCYNVDLTGAPFPTGVNNGTLCAGGGANYKAQLGPLPAFPTSYASLHMLAPGTAVSTTNYVLESDGNDLYISAPHPLGFGKVYFYAASSALMAVFDPVANTFTVKTSLKTAGPVSGDSAATMPFRWKSIAISQGSTADNTLAAGTYESVMLTITGTPGGNFNVIGPNQADAFFIVRNTTANICTFKRAGGTGIAIAAGKTAILSHIAGDYVRITPDT